MLSTISSVQDMALAPMLVRLCMLLSTEWSTMPSSAVTHLPSMANKDESIAVETPLVILREHAGLAYPRGPVHIGLPRDVQLAE